MPETIITPDLDSLVTEIDIVAPAEHVFKALTDPAQLKRWFYVSGMPGQDLEHGRSARRQVQLRHGKGQHRR
jgi:uncharacterized protein YndB with AHSA1/START domain